jgi:hypothetical protein
MKEGREYEMLIAFAGKAGSGKDAAGEVLVRNYRFTKVALADPMKRICQDVYGFSNEQLWGPSECRNAPDARWDGLTPRKALQLLGTEWARQCHPDTWVRYLIDTYDQLRDDVSYYTPQEGVFYTCEMRQIEYCTGDVVVTDVRFPNEVQAITQAGGHVFRVDRPSTTLTIDAAQHASETSLAGIPEKAFAGVIVNTGTLEDLERMVLRAYRHVMYRETTAILGRLWVTPTNEVVAL